MQLAAYLYLLPGDYDKHLQWPVKVNVHLIQQGDHNHHECIRSIEYKKATSTEACGCINDKFFSSADLAYKTKKKTLSTCNMTQ